MAVRASVSSLLSRCSAWLLVGINVLWGASSVAAKIALAHVPPMSLAFARFAVSAVLLYLLAGRRRVDLRVARGDWLLFWEVGAVGIGLSYVCAYSGLRLTTAADSALIQATEPVLLTVLSVVMLRERVGRRAALAIGLGLAGALLLVTRGGLHLRLTGAAGGDLLIALGLLFEALSVVWGKRLVARYPPLTVLTYQMTTGAILLAPCALAEGLTHRWRLPLDDAAWPTLLSLLYLIVICTVVAYTLWFLLLERLPANRLSAFLFVQPMSGAALGVVLQHDHLAPASVAGALLVLLALGMMRPRSPRKDPLPVA